MELLGPAVLRTRLDEHSGRLVPVEDLVDQRSPGCDVVDDARGVRKQRGDPTIALAVLGKLEVAFDDREGLLA